MLGSTNRSWVASNATRGGMMGEVMLLPQVNSPSFRLFFSLLREEVCGYNADATLYIEIRGKWRMVAWLETWRRAIIGRRGGEGEGKGKKEGLSHGWIGGMRK